MEKVFIIFSTDANHSYSSYTMEAVCTTKEIALSLIMPILRRESKKTYKDHGYNSADELLSDLTHDLTHLDQTQTLAVNYVIKEQPLDVFNCL